MAGLLKQYIQERFGVPTLYLHGGVPAKKRATMVEQFQSDQGPPVFLLSLRAGGTGLNLTRANHVFHFDRWWNPAVEDQATDRAFRIGQTKNVLVHKFVCLGTLEERLDALIEEKKALAESIVGSGENWLTETGWRLVILAYSRSLLISGGSKKAMLFCSKIGSSSSRELEKRSRLVSAVFTMNH